LVAQAAFSDGVSFGDMAYCSAAFAFERHVMGERRDPGSATPTC